MVQMEQKNVREQNLTENVPKGTENVREHNVFLIERKILAMKIDPN